MLMYGREAQSKTRIAVALIGVTLIPLLSGLLG